MSVHIRNLIRVFTTASQPASTATGDAWWRSDLSQMHVSDGGTSPIIVGPVSPLPVIRPSGWHVIPVYGAPGTMTVPADRLFAIPLWPGRNCTLTAAAVNVALAVVGGNIRMGLYASDGVLPTTLISDFGTVSAGVTGVRQISGLSTPVRPILRYLGVVRQGGVGTLSLSTRETCDPIISDASPVLDERRSAYYQDGVSGALPASFGTPAGALQGPAVSIQLT